MQRGENRVRIRRTFGEVVHEVWPTESTCGHKSRDLHGAGSARESRDHNRTALREKSSITVKSPIVGTFYEARLPGSPPFVKVGETVQPGQVLCIIESMKLMNEIEAEIAGVIESKLVENGQPVEYGEALFAIRPALRKFSSPTAEKSRCASSARARTWAFRPSRSTRKPTATACTCASPTKPSASARPRARAAISIFRPSSARPKSPMSTRFIPATVS